MATYTKEQIELVKQIRDLLAKQVLDYEETVLLYSLQDQANTQNLCWW